MKFTKEEVSLCKQVAERHRKEIKYGDWSLNEGGFIKVWPYRHNCKRIELIPLWTISDCLEFLKERGYRINLHENVLTDGIEITLNHPERVEDITNYIYKGKTPLEACLKAVLAVLEEEK